ncbi:glycosyltransferase family 1 protein [Haliscomenobacter sp.]|uniref:glycosyltransferase family 4 protein n=1 Tax=Haliscomenobacter sp. TaxID=2717303 RepID=UPI003364D916
MTKKILIITDNLPDQINGVVTTYKNIEACAVLDGYTVDYIDPRRFRHVDCPGYNEVKLAIPREMGKKIEEIDPDHIHIATEGPLGLWARKYLSICDYRYNTAYHTKFPEGLKKLFGIPEAVTWPLVRWFHKHSGKVLTTTETMVRELQSHGFKGEIVPWTRGVDRTVFNPTHRHTTVSRYILCVSRVSKEKNLEKFLEMDYLGYLKIMVGDGPMLETYRKQYPDVYFTGFKTGVDLAEYYANAEVFVFPSQWETFGIVMIEAMACGTPVAAYPCQGPEDVIDEGVTGCMNTDLKQAITDCLFLNRNQVWQGSQRWSWDRAWEIFRDNLVPTKPSKS